MGFKQTATAPLRQGVATTRSAWSAASSATCRWPSGSSSSPTPASTAGRKRRWELDLRKCDTDAGAAAYAKERVDLAKKHGLEIFTVATHLQGQVLGDEPSAKTLQLPQAARRGRPTRPGATAGNNPPRTDPYFVPDEVGKLIHAEAAEGPARLRPATPGTCRKLQDRKVALPGLRRLAGRTAGATGSCSRRCPASIDGHKIPDVRAGQPGAARRALRPGAGTCARSTASRSTWNATRASGRWATSSRRRDYINHMCKAGYEGVVGFNLDGSHMEWQNVSVIAVHPRVRRVHPLRPRQGRVGGPRALPGRPARRPPADGPLGQRLELRHRRHRPRRQQRWRRSSSS